MDNKQLKRYIEMQIRKDFFKTKEDLQKHILKLNQQEINRILTEKDIMDLLKTYDELHIQEELPLDMINYSNKKFNGQNYILSEEENRMLKTTGNSTEFIKEFKETQNQISAYNTDGAANAKEVFNKIATTKKEEIKLIPIHEAIAQSNVSVEMLQKISFFITKMKVNPFEYRIDVENGIFHNMETKQTYEVKKNEKTNQFEIHSSGEIKYENTTNVESETETLENDSEEERRYEEDRDKPKVKVRRLTDPRRLNNAAFTNISFLIVNIISFIIVSASVAVILLNK